MPGKYGGPYSMLPMNNHEKQPIPRTKILLVNSRICVSPQNGLLTFPIPD